jgi:hypothetical protein
LTVALKVAARSDFETDRFEDVLLGLGPRPTVFVFVLGFCRPNFFELLEKLFGSRY